MSLEEVKHHFEEESESGTSFNFDDGISALSAHTLEEMAKAEKMLQRQNRLTNEPQEQGFDVTLEQSSVIVNVPGPPSPAATEESIGSVDPCDDSHLGNNMKSKSFHQFDKEKELHNRQQRYPLQMARNPSNTGTSYISSVSIQSSSTNDFSDTWKQNDQDYWKNVKNDSPSKVSITSSSKTKHSFHQTLISQKQRKKKRRQNLFGRRKNYMECEEFDDEEYDI